MTKNMRIGMIGIGLLAVVGLTAHYTIGSKVWESRDMQGKFSEFNIGIENDQLYLEPVHLKTELEDYDIHFSKSVNRNNIVTVDNYGNFTYLTYKNKNGTTMNEILVTSKIPEGLNTKGLKKETFSNDAKVVSESNTIKGMKSINGGYLYMGTSSVKIPDNKTYASKLEKQATELKYIKHNKDRGLIINIDGIGKLDLGSISVLKDAPGMFYGKDKVLRLYNFKHDIVYVWVTHLNNGMMMNPAGNLQKTEYSNVYADKDYKDASKMGYRSYSVMTPSGIYTFKFSDKAPEGLQNELFALLNINKKDALIELPFKLNE